MGSLAEEVGTGAQTKRFQGLGFRVRGFDILFLAELDEREHTVAAPAAETYVLERSFAFLMALTMTGKALPTTSTSFVLSLQVT